MLRYRLQSKPPKFMYEGWQPKEAFVILEVNGRDERARYRVEGDPQFVETVRDALLRAHGFRGSILDEETTAIDLGCAMDGVMMRPYQPECIEGAEIFKD